MYVPNIWFFLPGFTVICEYSKYNIAITVIHDRGWSKGDEMAGHQYDPLYTIIIIVFVLLATHATVSLISP